MAFLFCEPWVHGFCAVFARSVLSMSDDVGRCIALQSVPFFASGEQCQAQLCLHFRVGILAQFQKSRHGDGGFATDLLRDFLRREALLVELPKIRRYLSMSLSALQVPVQEREQVIAFVAEIDMLAEARKVIDAVLASLSVQFDLKG